MDTCAHSFCDEIAATTVTVIPHLEGMRMMFEAEYKVCDKHSRNIPQQIVCDVYVTPN